MLPKQENYMVGIYLRLSKDDERQGESLSIENQRRVLVNYVKEQGWMLVSEYVDMYPPKMIQFNLSPPGGEGVEKISPP